jgi:hypothetical protein
MSTGPGRQGLLASSSFETIRLSKTQKLVGLCNSCEVPHVFKAQWTDSGLQPAHLRRAVCPRPLAGRRWSAYNSYEVPHVYKARWTDGGLPPGHLGQAVCPRPLAGRGWSACSSYEMPHVYKAR